MNTSTLLPPGVIPRQEKVRDDNISVAISPDQKARFARLCHQMHCSMASVARSLVEQWMDQVEEHLQAEAARAGGDQ